MEHLDFILNEVKEWLWGPPLLLLLLGTGLYLTILLKGVQFRYMKSAIRESFASSRKDAQGDISHFEALMTSLAGAIGTGSIVGVATAVAIGGPGALFWMWVTALVGMATKYAESLLAVKYRQIDKRGEMIGGPMEYIEIGLGWKWMAVVFAIFGSIAAIGTGNLVQVNSIVGAIDAVFIFDPWISGAIVAVLAGLVIIGGVKSIGHTAAVLVPFMALFYFTAGCIILVLNYDQIPAAFETIFVTAFSGQAAAGGFMGATMMMAIQIGVARSIFSNEAGLGISSIAAAAAKTDLPARQALVNMTGALLSTGIVCTITGLVIVVSGLLGTNGADGKLLNGAALAINAFQISLIGGAYVVTIGQVLFAFTTIIAWAYYGEKCCEYIFGEKSVIPYRILYILAIIPGAALKMETVWLVADIANALMVIPNLIALIMLSKDIVFETKRFIEVERLSAVK